MSEVKQVPGMAIIMTIAAPKGKEKHPTVLGIELGVETEDGQEMIYDGWENDMVTMVDNYLLKMYPNATPNEDLWKYVKFYDVKGIKNSPRDSLDEDRVIPNHVKGQPLTIEVDKKPGHSSICVFNGVFRDYIIKSGWFSIDRAHKNDHKVIAFLLPKMPSSWINDLCARLKARALLLKRVNKVA